MESESFLTRIDLPFPENVMAYDQTQIIIGKF